MCKHHEPGGGVGLSLVTRVSANRPSPSVKDAFSACGLLAMSSRDCPELIVTWEGEIPHRYARCSVQCSGPSLVSSVATKTPRSVPSPSPDSRLSTIRHPCGLPSDAECHGDNLRCVPWIVPLLPGRGCLPSRLRLPSCVTQIPHPPLLDQSVCRGDPV